MITRAGERIATVPLQRRFVKVHSSLTAFSQRLRLMTIPCLALGLFVVSPPVGGEESPPQEVGFVLKLNGEWLLNGKAIAAGETLPPGGKIYHSPRKAREPRPGEYIAVIFSNGKIESRSWDKIESWNDPIQLPAGEREAPSHWQRIVSAVMGVFPGHPEKYAQMSVRGSAAGLRDAVVDFNNGQLNLSPAFKQMKKGRYLLLFEPIGKTKASVEKAASEPIPFDWDPSAPQILSVDGLRPGLYQLSRRGVQSEDHLPVGTDAWVLVSDHARYEGTATTFQDAVILTEQWKEAPADAARSFLRAYLDFLAR